MTCQSRLVNQNSLHQFTALAFVIAITLGSAGCSMPWNKSSKAATGPDNMMAQQREKSLLPSAYPNDTPPSGMDSRARDIERRLGIK